MGISIQHTVTFYCDNIPCEQTVTSDRSDWLPDGWYRVKERGSSSDFCSLPHLITALQRWEQQHAEARAQLAAYDPYDEPPGYYN